MTEIAERVLNEGRQAYADAMIALFGAKDIANEGREAERLVGHLLHKIIGPVSHATLALDVFINERRK